MSIRIHGPSESMGGADIVDNMSSWSLENKPRRADADFMRNVPMDTTLLDRGKYPLIHPEKLHATFIEEEELGLGRAESQHQVRFGQMILNSAYDHEMPDLVAVKPFEIARDLHREWAANNYINSIGRYQRAFLPLGIWRRNNGDYNLITLYEHGVKSYDEVFWADRIGSPEALRAQVVEKAALTCVQGLGYLHGLGVVHGDAQAKNLAKDSRRVRFVDLESASLLPRVGSAVLEDAETDRLTSRDIDSFFGSTMLVSDNQDRIADVFNDYSMPVQLVRSYQDGLRRGSRESRLRLPAMIAESESFFSSLIRGL